MWSLFFSMYTQLVSTRYILRLLSSRVPLVRLLSIQPLPWSFSFLLSACVHLFIFAIFGLHLLYLWISTLLGSSYLLRPPFLPIPEQCNSPKHDRVCVVLFVLSFSASSLFLLGHLMLYCITPYRTSLARLES